MKRVLLVNDCKFENFIMEDVLNNLGYTVAVTNEYEVFIKIKKFKPDIVICNLIMKNVTGDKIIKSIKEKNSKIMCLLSSSNVMKLEDYDENYIDEIIHTPTEEKDLETILDKIVCKNKKVEKTDSSENKFSFCPYCGEKLEAYKDNFLFCPLCGHKL